MIIPPIKDIATSVQLVGRANGGKKYVQKHNIYIQKEHYTKISNRIDYALKLNQIKSILKQISEKKQIKKKIWLDGKYPYQ